MHRDAAKNLRERLGTGPPLLLDAAMGSDLNRRGLRTTLPLWSAIGLLERPDLVRQIHVENLRAGADIVTTNTFRTTARTLRRGGIDPAQADALDALAVQLAQEARDAVARPAALIAGAMAPLEDCYLPVFTTPPAIALAEHRAQARNLAQAGADLLLVETMPTSAEAVITLRAALETGLPATVGFVCAQPDGPGSPVRLLSGETLAEAVAAVEPLGPAAIMVNCAPPAVIDAALRELGALTSRPIGGYANIGQGADAEEWSPAGGIGGEEYATMARAWLDLGARVIGGCCGSHPAHTAALRRMIDARASQAPEPLATTRP